MMNDDDGSLLITVSVWLLLLQWFVYVDGPGNFLQTFNVREEWGQDDDPMKCSWFWWSYDDPMHLVLTTVMIFTW